MEEGGRAGMEVGLIETQSTVNNEPRSLARMQTAGTPPPLHTLHTLVAGPAGLGRLGGEHRWWLALCPCSTHSADRGNHGGILFPDIPVEPWAFLFFFQESCPFWTIRFFLANGNCGLRFPPLDAGTSEVKLG